MEPLQSYMDDYRKQLEKGHLQKAYQSLMQYIMDLRTQFSKNYPEYAPGNIYQGYMDMTYFALIPETLKKLKLKIAVVFVYETFRFEVWLAAQNKQVQNQYWKLFKESNWKKYRIVPATQGADSILEHTLADNPDFGDLKKLTDQIEKGTLSFIRDIEEFFAKKAV
jgi:hypothetical protein